MSESTEDDLEDSYSTEYTETSSVRNSVYSPDVSRKRELVPVSEWLTVRYLLKSLNDNIIEICYTEIMELFGTKKDIISTLLRASSDQQIQSIIKILNNAKTAEIENNDNKIIDHDIDDKNKNKSYFEYLSIESIFNVLEFLDKKSIKSFKLTSISNGLIVFDIMKCYRVSILNMNQFIEIQTQQNWDWSLSDTMTINRVKSFTKHEQLINNLCKRYNIPSQHILIIRSNVYNDNLHKFNGIILEYINKFNNEKIGNNKVWYILDKRKLLLLSSLNNTQKLQTLSEINNIAQIQPLDFVLLQYFDAEQGRIYNVQLLSYNTTMRHSDIQQYVLNHLCLIISKLYPYLSTSYVWCSTLMDKLNKMKEFHSEHRLINMYKKNKYGDFKQIDSISISLLNVDTQISSFRTILFELNQCHPYFAWKNDRKNIEIGVLKPYYTNVHQYIDDEAEKYMISIKYDDNDNFHDRITYFDHVYFEKLDDVYFEISVTPLTTYMMLKHQISLKFGNKIPADNIEIYDDKHFYINDQYLEIAMDELVKWRIVPYKTISVNQYKVCKVKIYDESANNKQIWFKFPKPTFEIYAKYEAKLSENEQIGTDYFEFEPIEIDDRRQRKWFYHHISLMSEYSQISVEELRFQDCWISNTELAVNVFLQNIMDNISHPMYDDDKYRVIIDKYKDKDKYSFIIMDRNNIDNEEYKCYHENDEFIPNKAAQINGYDINVVIIENQKQIIDDYKQNELEALPIIIRFELLWNAETTEDINNLYSDMNKEEADEIMIRYLLRKQQLDLLAVGDLNEMQRLEMEKGMACLDDVHRDELIDTLKRLLGEDGFYCDEYGVHIDIEEIDGPSLVKMYNYIQGIHKQNCSNIGYPMKIWITTQTLLEHILIVYLRDNSKFRFESCTFKYGNIRKCDNIYETIFDDTKYTNNSNLHQLFISLRI